MKGRCWSRSGRGKVKYIEDSQEYSLRSAVGVQLEKTVLLLYSQRDSLQKLQAVVVVADLCPVKYHFLLFDFLLRCRSSGNALATLQHSIVFWFAFLLFDELLRLSFITQIILKCSFGCLTFECGNTFRHRLVFLGTKHLAGKELQVRTSSTHS